MAKKKKKEKDTDRLSLQSLWKAFLERSIMEAFPGLVKMSAISMSLVLYIILFYKVNAEIAISLFKKLEGPDSWKMCVLCLTRLARTWPQN